VTAVSQPEAEICPADVDGGERKRWVRRKNNQSSRKTFSHLRGGITHFGVETSAMDGEAYPVTCPKMVIPYKNRDRVKTGRSVEGSRNDVFSQRGRENASESTKKRSEETGDAGSGLVRTGAGGTSREPRIVPTVHILLHNL